MTEPSAATVSHRDRHRARSLSTHERLFQQTIALRRQAVRKAPWVPDAAEAVDAAVWEAIASGVTNTTSLYDVARQAAVNQRTWELRLRRRPAMLRIDAVDLAERVAEVADAELYVRRVLATVPIRSAEAAVWIERMMGSTVGDPLPSRVKMAGGRWSERVRRVRCEFGACDEVA